uniref:Tyr recombinase domain-containing protein n=1 Tax=Graphocephala atropunctata TaxID=36148 RepID=A0A1B6KE83_9HEMI
MLIRKYMSLRPSSMTSDRFFVGYRYGKCVAQNVGANSIAAVPCKVAKYLGLENPEQYTGHALRRTSASMLVEGGGDLLTLKRHGGWKSSTVAEGYVEDSIARKIDVSKKLFAPLTASTSTAILDSASTSKQEVDKYFNIDDIFNESDEESDHQTNNKILNVMNKIPNKGISISNNKNCTINVNFHIK